MASDRPSDLMYGPLSARSPEDCVGFLVKPSSFLLDLAGADNCHLDLQRLPWRLHTLEELRGFIANSVNAMSRSGHGAGRDEG